MKIDRRRGSHDNNGLFDLPEADFEEQCMLITEAKILQFEDGQYLTKEDVFKYAPMNGARI